MDQNNPGQEPAQPIGGQAPVDPGYKYEDVHNQGVREIAEGQAPAAPAEETPKTPETPATPETPLEDVVKQASQEGAKAVLEEQKRQEEERLAAEKAAQEAQPTDKEKEYLDWEDQFKKQNSRPPTYQEALTFVTQQAVAEIEAKQEAKAKEETERLEAQKQEEQENEKKLNEFIDDELSELYNSNKLTRIKDPNNPSDPGVIERKELFATWQQVNAERTKNGQPLISSPIRIFDFYYKKPVTQVPGADAPVMGNKAPATPPSQEQSYSYQDLKRPWSFFRQGPNQS